MKIKINLLIALLFTFQMVVSQEIPFFESYDWEVSPNYTVDNEIEEDMIAVKEKTVTEFYFQDEDLVEFYLEHKVLWLNSDDAIEEYNKIYLPFSSDAELRVNKARVITPGGKIINLDKSKILTAEDEETGNTYKYFALEGISKGSFIEYMYVVKRPPNYTGKKFYIQDGYYKDKVEFDLYSPSNLLFKFKSYNNIQNVERDTLSTVKLHYKLHAAKVQKLENEYQAPYNASRGFIVYKMDKNVDNMDEDIISYSSIAQNVYASYYPEYSEKTKGLLNDFIKELALPKNADQESIIRKLDFYIKSTVYSQDVYNEDLQDLDLILTTQLANESGVIKLYIAVLRTLNIAHELVITTDRTEMKFDPEFEATNFLTDFLLYFPTSKRYLSPNASGTRYGFPMPYVTDNYGLFLKEGVVGDQKSVTGRIKYIEPVKVDEVLDVMKVTIDFNKENLTENTVHLDRTFSGYYAMNIQPFMHLIQGEDARNDLVDSFVESMTYEFEAQNRELINDDAELFGVKPLQIKVDFTTEAFVEKAGRKYLFKLGDLIGQQIELYQEKERVLPLEGQFHRGYKRTLTLHIPEGYKITNLDDINIDNSYVKDGKEIFFFKSSYQLEGNTLTVTANEYYKENIIEVAMYEDYRTVINSAADFNKIVLLLTAE
ncbi:DUF3857 domain-containing protein [Polaribacter atrinae]|uniref:DUF3857 domain-containing protein n=1 Tax=Polaribacter atrinae TaxID=1333662 RepID=A0A176TC88_9FLAO|nr:DUF3857 domain-containing protein [Polaribacter atrinae]OAD45492.1 hypothetical protein LPB303_07005 [Polaribacter atrinae]